MKSLARRGSPFLGKPKSPRRRSYADDLARLYWRRERLERAQEGLMRRAVLAVQEGQHRRRQEIAGATFGPAQPHMLDVSMSESADPGVRLRKLLSYLEVIREQARQRTFWPRQYHVLETLYQGMVGWRAGRLCRLLHLFADPAALGERKELENEEGRKMAGETGGPMEEAGEAQYQELLRLLEEEMAYVRGEFEYAEKVNEEKAAIERDAALAPVGEVWTTLARQQAALDRSIDRKVRILLALRKEFTRLHLPEPPADPVSEAEREEIDKIVDRDMFPVLPPTQEPVATKTERTNRECH